MKNSIRIVAIILTFLFQNLLRSQDNNLDGWQKWGSKPDFYDIGLDDEKYNDKPVYFLKSNADVIDGFGTIAKNIIPEEYIGKRLRLSGYIKTINSGGTGMWMRVDGNEMGKSLQFDNMGSRQIMGTTEWQKYEIVLDIPATSRGIYYGVLTTGSSEAKISDLIFDVVDTSIASTNMLPIWAPSDNNNYSELPKKLKDISDGIIVKHTPDTVYAEKTGKDTVIYYWNFVTTVKPMTQDLEIIEFGVYSWIGGLWVPSTITGKPFTNKDFREWYKCKKGKMKFGKEYSDKSNWARNPLLQNSKDLWYYIGMSRDGNLYKGTAMIDCLAEEKK